MRSFSQFHQNLRGSAPSPLKAFAQPPVVVLDPRVEDLQVQVESVAASQAEVSQDIVQRVDVLETKVDEVSSAVLVLNPNPVSPPPPESPPPPPPDPVDPPVDPVVVGEPAPSVFEMIRGIFK